MRGGPAAFAAVARISNDHFSHKRLFLPSLAAPSPTLRRAGLALLPLALLLALLIPAALTSASQHNLCEYDPTLRTAIESTLEIRYFQCDDPDAVQLDEITYLDLQNLELEEFDFDQYELSGFDPFAVIDLRGNDLEVGDINPASIPLFDEDDQEVFYTFWLDVDSSNGPAVCRSNGFADPRYMTVEGQPFLVTYYWGDRPDRTDVQAARRTQNPTAERVYFSHLIRSEQDDPTVSGDRRYDRYLTTASDDPTGILYVIAMPVHDDGEIEDDSVDEVELRGVAATTDRTQLGRLDPEDGVDVFDSSNAPLNEYIDDYEDDALLTEVDLVVSDDDDPVNPVCSRSIADQLEDLVGKSNCNNISRPDLARRFTEFDLSHQGLRALAAGDLDGLTGVEKLDLSGNNLTTLPRGIFTQLGTELIAGYPEERTQEVLIDLRSNDGGTGTGFFHTDLPAHVRADLREHQRIALDTGAGLTGGFDRDFYEVAEGGTLNFIVSFFDVDRPAIRFIVLASDSAEGDITDDSVSFDLPGLTPGLSAPVAYRLYHLRDVESSLTGTFVVAVDIPEEAIDDGQDDTFTLQLAGLNGTGQPIAQARVTIVEGTPTIGPPGNGPPGFGTWLVVDNEHIADDKNPTLLHNVPELTALVDGQQLSADFRGHYRRTGGLTRWGLPTSEVLVAEASTLTQYYQRGLVDFHRRGDLGGIWVMERRLAWDYFGGGIAGSPDQGVEPGTSNSYIGIQQGPWGHKVSNFAVDGTVTGFETFFISLGGVEAFGYPKTEARVDTNLPGTLHIDAATPGFIRQYFQSAVLEFHPGVPGDPIQLRLLGDDLRNQQFPNAAFAQLPPFQAAAELPDGAFFTPGTVTVTQAATVPPRRVG